MSRRSNPEDFIKAGLAVLLLIALAIGGLAHFAEVMKMLVVGLVILAAGAGLVFLTWKSGLRGTTKWAVTLAIGGLLLLGYWKIIQPPAEWPSADVTVTGIKTPPASVRLTYAFSLGRQGFTGTLVRTYPTMAAAQTDLPNMRGRKTAIFYNPADPTEIESGFRSGWKGASGTIVDALILPQVETRTEVSGFIHEGLVPTSVQIKVPPDAELPNVGQKLRIYTNQENSTQLSLVPQVTAGPQKETRLLVLAVLALLGAFALGTFSWRHRHDRPDESSSPAPVMPTMSNLPPVQASPPTGPSIATLRAIDWYQFEQLVARLLTHEGYQVTRQGGAKADGGVDLIALKQGVKTVVQCKHWQNWRVKEGTIREMIGILKLQGADRLSLYTLNPSTGPADQLARNQGIEIVTEDQIVSRLQAAGPDRFTDLLDPDNKHCPICDAPMKLRTGGFKPFWGCTRFPGCRGKIEAS